MKMLYRTRSTLVTLHCANSNAKHDKTHAVSLKSYLRNILDRFLNPKLYIRTHTSKYLYEQNVVFHSTLKRFFSCFANNSTSSLITVIRRGLMSPEVGKRYRDEYFASRHGIRGTQTQSSLLVFLFSFHFFFSFYFFLCVRFSLIIIIFFR